MAHVTENTTGIISLKSTAAAIGLGVRVKLDSSGLISAAGVTDAWIGVTTDPIAASTYGSVKLRGTNGSFLVVAAGAVEVGDVLYAAASGKVNDVQLGGGFTGLQAKTAAGADGDIIEAVPVSNTPEIVVIPLPITLANVADGDVLTNYPLTFNGTVTAIDFAVTTAVTTGSKATTLNLEIGTTNLTGGTVALTSANCTPLGKVVSSAAITGANTFVSGDTLSVEASSTTAFAEGAGVLLITCVKN
jgi:hypothetical protein